MNTVTPTSTVSTWLQDYGHITGRATTQRLQCAQANEQLQARLHALRSQPSALSQAQAKQGEHIRDRDKFRTLIDNLQARFYALDLCLNVLVLSLSTLIGQCMS
jgi:hypothetical protein